MKKLCLLIILALVSACATGKYHDREVTDPNYNEGSSIPMTNKMGVGGVYQSPLVSPPDTSAELAIIGLVESGISLATNPDYYKPSTISGICIIGEGGVSEVPCHHLAIDLLDEKGKVLGISSCNDAGRFAFYVKKDKSYLLRVEDSRYSLLDKVQPLRMGANVILHLSGPKKDL